jgi:uroporphyrin-III C-methyltransferase/precorrin-2 dehydrogenase/sirohydrochlorin ferrochelatase
MTAEPLFPLFLKLQGKEVLVVGGGAVAAGKVANLVDAGARVTVVAPQVCDAIRTRGVTIVERAFELSDLAGAWLVVAAAPAAVNRLVAEAAERLRIFVNAVDDPAHASAYAASVVTRGPLVLAISTSGVAPALAALLREALADLLPDDVEEWVEETMRQRLLWRRDGVPMAARRERLLDRLNELYGSRGRRQPRPGEAGGVL